MVIRPLPPPHQNNLGFGSNFRVQLKQPFQGAENANRFELMKEALDDFSTGIRPAHVNVADHSFTSRRGIQGHLLECARNYVAWVMEDGWMEVVCRDDLDQRVAFNLRDALSRVPFYAITHDIQAPEEPITINTLDRFTQNRLDQLGIPITI